MGVTADKGESKEDKRPEGRGGTTCRQVQWEVRSGQAGGSGFIFIARCPPGSPWSKLFLGREGGVGKGGVGEDRGSVK